VQCAGTSGAPTRYDDPRGPVRRESRTGGAMPLRAVGYLLLRPATQQCIAAIENAHLAEFSLVYDGATPGASVIRAQQEAEAGRIRPEQARLIEQRYRIHLPERRRVVQGASVPERTAPPAASVADDAPERLPAAAYRTPGYPRPISPQVAYRTPYVARPNIRSLQRASAIVDARDGRDAEPDPLPAAAYRCGEQTRPVPPHERFKVR
jgi:hypothetical protein